MHEIEGQIKRGRSQPNVSKWNQAQRAQNLHSLYISRTIKNKNMKILKFYIKIHLSGSSIKTV